MDKDIEGDILKGFAMVILNLVIPSQHSQILKITYDNATAVETRIQVVGPTEKSRPANHPFNEPKFTSGQQVSVMGRPMVGRLDKRNKR